MGGNERRAAIRVRGARRTLARATALILSLALSCAGAALVSPSVTAGAELVVPPCSLDDVPSPDAGYSAWATTLLDWTYRLPSTYAPPTVSLSRAGFRAAHGGGLRMRALPALIADLSALRAAAARAGVPIAVQSAYRGYWLQAATFRSWVRAVGFANAVHLSARPGHSEHQLGTAFDFRSARSRTLWTRQDFGQTPTGRWLAAEAWKFGFVASYPAHSDEITCYKYEPWHYRYVGRALATKIKASGLVTRIWLLNPDWTAGTGADATTETGTEDDPGVPPPPLTP